MMTSKFNIAQKSKVLKSMVVNTNQDEKENVDDEENIPPFPSSGQVLVCCPWGYPFEAKYIWNNFQIIKEKTTYTAYFP